MQFYVVDMGICTLGCADVRTYYMRWGKCGVAKSQQAVNICTVNKLPHLFNSINIYGIV